MPDQAQGLRALADRARRDQFGPSLVSDGEPIDGKPVAQAVPPTSLHTIAHPEAVVAAPQRFGNDMETEESIPVASIQSFQTLTSPHAAALPAERRARVIAVTSGKGGVGKTNFSTNLGLAFAARGQKVILVDADLGLANLHVLMGLAPRYNLEHILRGERSIQETLCAGPCGIRLLCGASGIVGLADLEPEERSYFINNLKELDALADLVIIDTGAGLSRNVLAILSAVEEVIVVTTPEPTAITDAYATIKVLSQENSNTRLMLVLNMVQHEAEGHQVSERLNSITQRFLNQSIDYLGHVLHDPAVSHAVRAQQPFILAAPSSGAARCVRQIASRLDCEEERPRQVEGIGGLLGRIQRYFGFNQATVRSRP